MSENGGERIGAREALAVYRDRRMAKIVLLGAISGFPWLLIGSMLSLWLKDEELSRTGIGLFGLVFSVYAVNALWAPVVDRVRIPFLSAKFGRRRAWIFAMQFVIACAMIAMASISSATDSLVFIALFALIIATASATQDVAVDALRIELIGEKERQKIGAGAAMATSGWWLGFGGGKIIALPLVEWMQEVGIANAWQVGYLAMLVVVGICVVLLALCVPEKKIENSPFFAAQHSPTESNLLYTNPVSRLLLSLRVTRSILIVYAKPIESFMSRHTVRIGGLLLLFVFLFKIGEAFLGRMSVVFYREVGFSVSDIGIMSGGAGTITVCVFSVLGGIVNARYGLMAGIVLGGVAMAGTNLLFAALAYHPEPWLFVTAVVADQFTTAVSTVAFVAFLSQLCDRKHTATQYAALASLGNLSRTTLASFSGVMVDGMESNVIHNWLDKFQSVNFVEILGTEILNLLPAVSLFTWGCFFVLTTTMVFPALAILFFARRSLAPTMRGATTQIF